MTNHNEFCTKRTLSTEISFHDVIHRNKVPMFHTKKVIVKKDKTIKVINANRDIIGKLLILSTKYNKPIDLEGALTYPLFSVPLSLAYPGGVKRGYQKSNLLPLLMPNFENLNNTNGPNKVHCVYIMDMIAQLRTCFTNLPSTYEELIIRFLQPIRQGYRQVHIIADTYRDGSIKSGEREKRGSAAKVIIASVKSKLPRDMKQFMLNYENKTQFIQLIFTFVKINQYLVLQDILQTDCVVLSGGNDCCLVQLGNVGESYHLTSNQEEADTKVI